MYVGPLVAGVISVVGDLSTGWIPPDSIPLLRICADLWLTKVISDGSLVSVTAQFPADFATPETLRLAIGGVLEGVKRVRNAGSVKLLGPQQDVRV
jgi:hypothetical protein